ncbi:hypothetical protein ADUPG1_014868 [Aduncisulcus paluster]|uniref:Lipid-binding serum glycoprotein C-terminal domain-containing protein n=7 Tax=Aduncisulcus paluster TaxID=2918883 RepID=A0ABQ5KES8_9EUKA|nr:hypothetical protein ADUPG1_014868 [Aduncisulcus paluster]
MGTLDIPNYSTTFDFGIGKASVALNTFVLTSYSFFPQDQILMSTEPSINGLFTSLTGAAMDLTVAYEIKLLTYPYSELSGSAEVSIQGLGAILTVTFEEAPDTSDLTCNNGKDACGYDISFSLEQFTLALDQLNLYFLGASSPILEAVADILDSSLIPFFVSELSRLVEQKIVNDASKVFSNFGLNDPYGFYEHIYWYLGIAHGLVMADNCIVIPAFSICAVGSSDAERETTVDPSYDPTPSLPYNSFDSQFELTISLSSIATVFYNTIHNANDIFSGWKATFDTVACVSTRYGCYDSKKEQWTGGLSSQDVVRNNMGRNINAPPSSLSPLFTTEYWQTSFPDLSSICSSCYIDVSYTFNTIDNEPTVPVLTMDIDGLTAEYLGFVLVVDFVDVISGDLILSSTFSADITTKSIAWSDHAYVNFLQSVSSVGNIVIESCSSESSVVDFDGNMRNNDTSKNRILNNGNSVVIDQCGMGLDDWNSFLHIISTVFLNAFDDEARNDDGTVICLSQL